MKLKLTVALTMALTIAGVGVMVAMQAATQNVQRVARSRPQGPCDIYEAAGDPCVAAHSTTRALYANFNGFLYQVLRQSDGKTLDIGVVRPPAGGGPGGYADAAAQDAFCANTYCFITKIYDQSPKHNDLTQAPRGGFSGNALGGFNHLPIADMAPVMVMGHKVYGTFIAPGMGLRNNDPKGTAVDDQAEGQYWVINGLHYNDGCCFDYGNAETDSRDDGNGTMETTYYGNSKGWYYGTGNGPWIMTDQENNLVGCVNASPNDKKCDLTSITWRFVTAMAKGEPHHWTSLGGDAQQGPLKVMFDGPRIDKSYDPMRKQGAILLGNGGDNSVGSQGTFYEGAMTAAGTFPTDATDQLIQANVVAAQYQAAPLGVAGGATAKTDTHPSLQTFTPSSTQDTTVTFTNTTGAAVSGVNLSLTAPTTWKAAAKGSAAFATVDAGATVSATFAVTSGATALNADIIARAKWSDAAKAAHSDSAVLKARNAPAVKINEFQIASGAPANATNAFIELHNADTKPVDISNWSVTTHAVWLPAFSSIRMPPGTTLAPGGFYLLGLSNSGLAAQAHRNDKVIYARSVTGMAVGDAISVEAEARTIAAIGTAAAPATTLWQPLPDGPVMTIPVGATNVPVTNITGFVVGEKIAIGYGTTYPVVGRTMEKYEVATVTSIGKQGTQGRLSAAAPAGTSVLKVNNVDNISVGDKIRLDIASVGHGIEWVTVTAVGTAGANGTGLTIAEKLKFDHASNMPFSDRGTGITFTPATKFAHSSNEPVQALGSGITLDKPLAFEHAVDAVVRDVKVTTAGYQGPATPQQWFGGPALATNGGSIILRTTGGFVVDSLNYGLLVDPWAAEGYQATSGAGQGGCRVATPNVGRAGGPGVNRSAGRFPDGADADSNCTDFLVQSATTMPAAAVAGATNIKVANLSDFTAGQTLIIDAGADSETAVIATVGTTGATTMGAESAVGATTITVAGVQGFSVGQTITIGDGAAQETAVIASSQQGRGGGPGARPGGPAPTPSTITLTAPLKMAHASGAQVSGSGITLTAALKRAHAIGTPVQTSVPTPGTKNSYVKR